MSDVEWRGFRDTFLILLTAGIEDGLKLGRQSNEARWAMMTGVVALTSPYTPFGSPVLGYTYGSPPQYGEQHDSVCQVVRGNRGLIDHPFIVIS